MKPFKTAAAGDARDPMREVEPPKRDRPPAAAGPVVLSTLDAERLRTAYLTLTSLCDELSLGMSTFMLHGLSEPSAFEVFPDGKMKDLTGISTWDSKRDRHHAHLFVPLRERVS